MCKATCQTSNKLKETINTLKERNRVIKHLHIALTLSIVVNLITTISIIRGLL